jgi:nitrogen fixation/metabolism regulation signal transduction histidine kinase
MSQRPSELRVPLKFKLLAILVAIATVPLVVSAVLIEQIATVAQNFSSNEAARLLPPLRDAQGTYRELVASKKRLYRQVARDLARAADPLAAAPSWFAAQPELHEIAVLDAAGQAQRLVRPTGTAPARLVHEREALPGGRTLELSFAVDPTLSQRYAQLGAILRSSERVDVVRTALPASYRTAFLVLVGGCVFLVTATGIAFARRLTGRIAVLVDGTRRVARGDLTARVSLPGGDELALLAAQFNTMVSQLQRDREQIVHLQQMSAWQHVARRLAHEIKNPLTPIQLAVQQCVSSYRGDDERYRALLRDTSEIVGEEIAGLRRLVDAFRELGRLPEVCAAPLELSLLIEDLRKEPELAERLTVRAPGGSVCIRGDRLLLRRVLHNLVENAVHAGVAAGKRGEVHLSWYADADAGCAVVLVDDEGSGVPVDLCARIFEPYFTTKSEGTGLGLAISKKIAIEHGGALVAAAEPAPSGGARFVLSVPLAERDREPTAGGV